MVLFPGLQSDTCTPVMYLWYYAKLKTQKEACIVRNAVSPSIQYMIQTSLMLGYAA